MRKCLTVAAAVIGGLALGTAIAMALYKTVGTFCPVCGGRLGARKGYVVCASCGAKLRLEEH